MLPSVFTASEMPGAQDILFASTCWCVDAVTLHVRWNLIQIKQLLVQMKFTTDVG